MIDRFIRRHRKSLGCGLAGLATLVASTAGAASAPPDLSGFWIPQAGGPQAGKADLTADFKRHSVAAGAAAPGVTQAYAERWCIHRGMPSQMFTSGPVDVLQARGETAIVFDVDGMARYIYTDGRKRPSDDILDGTTNGFSLGHWEGQTFVVETSGFSNEGVRDIPGGGWRGEKSHLVERFELGNGGKTLTVTETWTDPTVFKRPQVIKLVFDRAPANFAGKELICDGVKPERARPTMVGHY